MIVAQLCRRIGAGRSTRNFSNASTNFVVRNGPRRFCTDANRGGSANSGARVEGNCTKQLSRYQILVKEYGKIAVGTHVFISTCILTGVYVALDRGVDVAGLVRKAGCDSLADSTEKIMASSLGTFGVAFGIYKSLGPIRWPFTIFIVPFVARGLKRIRL